MKVEKENTRTTRDKEFQFLSFRQTLDLLDCSKFYLYKLIKKRILHSYYLEVDEGGHPTGKPYFNKEEISEVFFRKSKEE